METIGAMTDEVFKNPNYIEISKKFCPAPAVTHYEMVSITVLLPGLEIPVHYDAPYFKSVSRMTTPPKGLKSGRPCCHHSFKLEFKVYWSKLSSEIAKSYG